MFVDFKSYVIERFGEKIWEQTAKNLKIEEKVYSNYQSYSDEEIKALLLEVAKLTENSEQGIEEDFGVFIAPRLIKMNAHIISANWSAMEILLHTGKIIHHRISQSIPSSTLPMTRIEQNSPNRLTIFYQSPRKMCFLAKGIIKGIAHYDHKDVVIMESECMHEEGKQCILQVSLFDVKKEHSPKDN